jgi:hypothetical protein
MINQLICYVDADHASNLDDRRSTSGYVIILNSGPISWNVAVQKTPSSSPTESEYKSLHHGTLEVIWLRQLTNELGYFQHSATSIKEDNESTIKCTQNAVSHSKMKHIDIKYHVIRDYIAQKQIDVNWISTTDQLADIFTKALPPGSFKRLRDQLIQVHEGRSTKKQRIV